jgi:hypothetical protein
LRLLGGAIAAQVSQCRKKLVRAVVYEGNALGKLDRHPCPHSNVAIVVDEIQRAELCETRHG